MSEPQWKSVSWGECNSCGGEAEVFTTLEGEKAFDGDSARCTGCGCPGSVSVDDSLDAPDGDDGVASIQWHDEPDCSCWWCKMQNQLDALRDENARLTEESQRAASVRVVKTIIHNNTSESIGTLSPSLLHEESLQPNQSLAIIERPAEAAAREGKKP